MGLKHRPLEALNAVEFRGKPFSQPASASYMARLFAANTITTPNNASADTIAITANVVLLFISEAQ